ncbi:MAG TPA: GntR family transcriptional regulator [Zeimonas sp.]
MATTAHASPAPAARAGDTAAAQRSSAGIRILEAAPSLYEQVYASLLDAICAGVLRPGDRLNQDELAARLGVSRQPLTQALTVLRTQGFAHEAGRRGLVVAPLARDFFARLYELRESLDPMAARLAASRFAALPPDVQEATAAPARALIERGRAALARGEIAELTGADMAFHIWLYEAAGNPLLTETLRLYWNHLRRAMIAVLEPVGTRERTWDEHEAILGAVLAGDARRAQRLSLHHIRGAARRVIAPLDRR